MLAVVPSSFQSCVYFNVHGRVTWRGIDDDNWLGSGGSRVVPHAPKAGVSHLFLGQIGNTLSFAGRTGSVAATQLNFASLAQDQPLTIGQQMNMEAFQ